MSDPLALLEHELELAAGRLGQRQPQGRVRRSRRLLAGLVAGLIVLGAPALAAVTDTWPGRGTAATNAPRIQFPISADEPAPALRSVFSVLSRKGRPDDRLPTNATLPPLASGLQLKATRRIIATPEGGAYLVPVDHVLSRPIQTLEPAARTGPPGFCLALTADAPTVFSCTSTAQFVGDEGGGLSLQTALCMPGLDSDQVAVQGLAADQVTAMAVTLSDGASVPLKPHDNVVDETFARTNAPVAVTWRFGTEAYSRALTLPPRAKPCS